MIDVPVKVRDALRDGRSKKNYRIQVLDSYDNVDFSIDNNNLVTESVKIDERMCSADSIKFGLCEGSSLEFQYFDKPNINGKRLKVFIDVVIADYPKVELDANDEYITPVTGDYRLSNPNGSQFHGAKISWQTPDGSTLTIDILGGETYTETIDENTVLTALDDGIVITPPGYEESSISMGYFTVEKCPRQASTGIMKATAYNKLKSTYLDAAANIAIQNMDSETADETKVSLTTITRNLLSDYGIKEPDESTTSVSLVSDAESLYASLPSFKLIGSNTTYYPLVYGTRRPKDGDITWVREFQVGIKSNNSVFSGNRFRFSIANSIAAIRKSVTELKQWIFDNVQNGQSYWDALSSSNSDLYSLAEVVIKYRDGAAVYTIPEIMHVFPSTEDVRNIDMLKYAQNLLYDSSSSGQYNYTILLSFFNQLRLYTNSGHTSGEQIAWANITSSIFGSGNYIYYAPVTAQDQILIDKSMTKDITLRELQSASYELNCQFGKLDRETDLFYGMELNNSRLLPRDNLYPANNLYPGGEAERGNKSFYSKLWTDSQGKLTFRYLIITYKGLDENDQEKDYILQRTVNANGNTDYVMSDNWLFRNLVWTAANVGTFADAMVTKMQNISWIPFEMWCAGLPYIETGDEIEIITSSGTYTSYILQRQLQGIQNLQDTYINGTLDVF